jgi:hypothetical protein
VRLTRAQRRELLREGRAFKERHRGYADETADYLIGLMFERERAGTLQLRYDDPIEVSDYAYGMAHWVHAGQIF